MLKHMCKIKIALNAKYLYLGSARGVARDAGMDVISFSEVRRSKVARLSASAFSGC